MKYIFLLLLITTSFSYSSEFKPLDCEKEYLFKFFDRAENIDTKNKMKLISIDQRQEFIVVEDKEGKSFRISKKDLHVTQRSHLFLSSWTEKQSTLKKIQENKKSKETMKIVVGKSYKLPITKSGKTKFYECKIVSISEESVKVEYDEDRVYFLNFNNLPLKYSKVLFPIKYKELMDLRDKYFIGKIQVGDIKKKSKSASSYIYFIPQNINKNIKNINIYIHVSSAKYKFSQSLKINIKNHRLVDNCLFKQNLDGFTGQQTMEERKNLFIKSLKSDDLKIRISYSGGVLKSDEVFSLPNNPNINFVDIDFSYWKKL